MHSCILLDIYWHRMAMHGLMNIKCNSCWKNFYIKPSCVSQIHRQIKSSKWGFRSSGMWHFVIPLVVLKALHSFRTLRNTAATIRHHIPVDWIPRNINVRNLYFESSYGYKGHWKLLQCKLCWLVNIYWHYRGTCYLNRLGSSSWDPPECWYPYTNPIKCY